VTNRLIGNAILGGIIMTTVMISRHLIYGEQITLEMLSALLWMIPLFIVLMTFAQWGYEQRRKAQSERTVDINEQNE